LYERKGRIKPLKGIRDDPFYRFDPRSIFVDRDWIEIRSEMAVLGHRFLRKGLRGRYRYTPRHRSLADNILTTSHDDILAVIPFSSRYRDAVLFVVIILR
jgi:hypothetical protein